jgi:hypothetical protein
MCLLSSTSCFVFPLFRASSPIKDFPCSIFTFSAETMVILLVLLSNCPLSLFFSHIGVFLLVLLLYKVLDQDFFFFSTDNISSICYFFFFICFF